MNSSQIGRIFHVQILQTGILRRMQNYKNMTFNFSVQQSGFVEEANAGIL